MGFFGHCNEWVDEYSKRRRDLDKEMNDRGMFTYIQVDYAFWNSMFTFGVSGHCAVRIGISDGRVLYLDDGNLGHADHVFLEDEVPKWYYPSPDYTRRKASFEVESR